MTEFTPEEISVLEKYVSDPAGDTFVLLDTLTGLKGALYARYSRAKGSLRQTLLNEFLKDGKLNLDHAADLVEKILNAFGDDSVGELEGAHLALERISNLLTKIVEDCRIGGSPIEQSTRYVFYDQRDAEGRYSYLRPEEIVRAGLLPQYEKDMDFIFDTYTTAMPKLIEFLKTLKSADKSSYAFKPNDKTKYRLAQLTDEEDIRKFKTTYTADIRSKACDIDRLLLPAATLTNVGLFGNGRYFTALITKLLSGELTEARERGVAAKHELSKVIPKYVKRGKENPYFKNIDRDMQVLPLVSLLAKKETTFLPTRPDNNPVVDLLVGNDLGLELSQIAHILYPYCPLSLLSIYTLLRETCNNEELEKVVRTYCGLDGRKNDNDPTGRRNRMGRSMEGCYPLTFDFVADFGIYRDLQRHRQLTQQRQLLNPHLGWVMSEEFEAIGMRQQYEECIGRSANLFETLKGACGPIVAQYAVLFAFKIRWYMGMNLREAQHLIELRTTKQGHPSYRKVCQLMHNELMQRLPRFAKFINCDHNTYYWSRAESEARQRAKES